MFAIGTAASFSLLLFLPAFQHFLYKLTGREKRRIHGIKQVGRRSSVPVGSVDRFLRKGNCINALRNNFGLASPTISVHSPERRDKLLGGVIFVLVERCRTLSTVQFFIFYRLNF